MILSSNIAMTEIFDRLSVIRDPTLYSWRRPCCTLTRDFKNRQRGGLENARTESGAGASTAY